MRTSSRASFTIDGNLSGLSARAELGAFVGVMILIKSDWARPWLSGVLASDASLSLVTEKHEVSGVHQMSPWWVEFLK